MTTYAAACLSMFLQAQERGIELPVQDVQAVLCEDGVTVMLDAPVSPHEWICASFELPAKAEEETFDPEPYLQGFREIEMRSAKS